jgi:gamma-glutamylcyclotransferase (GGCT)/AIG2-like uncharacterized protein YtfP
VPHLTAVPHLPAGPHLTAVSPPLLPLFVYGSLRDPDIRRFVLGHSDVTTMPATLAGHVVERVPSFDFPFLVPTDDDTSQVEGELLLGLTAGDYVMLDSYEDTDHGLYVRARVRLQTADGSREAFAYLRGPGAPER